MTPLPATDRIPTGFAHPDYADSLAEFGQPFQLPRSGGWLLRRSIEGSAYSDAMGLYPLLICADWSRLHLDLTDIADEVVSVVAVTDPFAGQSEFSLHRAFDRVVPFKDHYVAELSRPPQEFVGRSHRSHARRALQAIDVQVAERPWDYLDEWVDLYANLVRRYAISGLRVFSRRAFEKQLRTPGMVMFRATAGGEVVGLDLWFVLGDVAYGHLAAFSDLGYSLRASYATKWTMLHHFMGRVAWVDLAGSVGPSGAGADGLSQFKKGWSTGIKMTYLCGRVMQQDAYADLTGSRPTSHQGYFPAYRAGDFG
jgi:hypothetical protein